MQRLTALLALAMMALPLATAQSPQTGIFYWCSFVEGGSNINSISFGAVPRTTILGLSQGQTSAPCHHPYGGVFPFISSDANSYTYSNGTAYPTNNGASLYAIAPSPCLVRDDLPQAAIQAGWMDGVFADSAPNFT
jgi:hypothetical protein